LSLRVISVRGRASVKGVDKRREEAKEWVWGFQALSGLQLMGEVRVRKPMRKPTPAIMARKNENTEEDVVQLLDSSRRDLCSRKRPQSETENYADPPGGAEPRTPRGKPQNKRGLKASDQY